MRFASQAGSCAPEKFEFKQSKASPSRRFLSHCLFSALLMIALGAGASVAQAQSCAKYQGAGGNWFSSAVGAAQSDLPETYCQYGYCLTDFSVDPSTCQSASNWICYANWTKIDAPGNNICEQIPGFCGPQGPTYQLVGLAGSGPCQTYWVTAQTNNETCSSGCVGDPINPGPGNVYKKKDDDVSVTGVVEQLGKDRGYPRRKFESRKRWHSAHAEGAVFTSGIS
jgi:hypothetical protein